MLKPPLPNLVRIEPRMVCTLCEGNRMYPATWATTPDGLRRFQIHLSDTHRVTLTQHDIDGITNA